MDIKSCQRKNQNAKQSYDSKMEDLRYEQFYQSHSHNNSCTSMMQASPGADSEKNFERRTFYKSCWRRRPFFSLFSESNRFILPLFSLFLWVLGATRYIHVPPTWIRLMSICQFFEGRKTGLLNTNPQLIVYLLKIPFIYSRFQKQLFILDIMPTIITETQLC